MTEAIDPYTPWQESAEDLRRRTVAREDLLADIERSVQQHLAGGRPIHLYLFGPRGAGKSHILVLAAERFRHLGATTIVIPEDIPELKTAAAVLGRIANCHAPARALPRWARPLHAVPLPQHAIIIFEGFDRQLSSMSVDERRKLRGLLQDRPGWWLVTTGTCLTEPLVGREEPFFGTFSPVPVLPLSTEEAEDLLDRLAGEAASGASWPARRRTLATLAGGSPRTLIALGAACAREPEAWASDHLHAVVRTFTAHYQIRFRDLGPDAQRVVEAIAESAAEMTPTELAAILAVKETSQASKVARRLVDDAVLVVREGGRHSWYTLAEPLFRYWHEYRTAGWEASRIGWLGRLIEAVLSPEEVARAWSVSEDESFLRVLEDVATRSPGQVLPFVAERLGLAPEPRRDRLMARLNRLPPHRLIELADALQAPERRSGFRTVFQNGGLLMVPAAWDFETQAASGQVRPAFRELLSTLDDLARPLSARGMQYVDRTVEGVMRRVEQRGQPWVLAAPERSALARLPFLRASFLQHGKLTSHPPLIDPRDILEAGLPEPASDWPILLGAAMVRQNEALFAPLVSAALGFRSPSPPPHNPRPAWPVPGTPSTLLDVLGGQLQQYPQMLPQALTWVGSAALASGEAFGRFVEVVGRVKGDGTAPRRSQILPVEAALLALGRRDPARLDLLRAACQRWDWLASAFAGVHAILAAASPFTGARPHPEIARLVELFAARPGTGEDNAPMRDPPPRAAAALAKESP